MQRKIIIFVLATCSIFAVAQQSMNNDTVVKMHAAGLTDEMIVSTIAAQPGTYATSVDDLIALKKSGLTDRVIGAMIVKNGNSAVTPATQGVPPAGATSDPQQGPPPDPSGQPRVFLQSASKGNNVGSARDQSMEMSKDFEKDCPGTKITINQTAADYTVVLNHIEQGFLRDNQFQIANKNGDLISKTKEGGSIEGGVKKACAFILQDWAPKPHQQ